MVTGGRRRARTRAINLKTVAALFAAAAVLAGASMAVIAATQHPVVSAKTGQTHSPVSKSDIAASQARQSEIPAPGHASSHLFPGDPIPAVNSTSGVIDTTSGLISAFGSDVQYVAETSKVAKPIAVDMHSDACLLAWASKTLPTLLGTSRLDVETVCGRPAAVIAGGYGTVGSELIGRAASDPKLADIAALVFSHPSLDYASVATADGKGVLVVVAAPTI